MTITVRWVVGSSQVDASNRGDHAGVDWQPDGIREERGALRPVGLAYGNWIGEYWPNERCFVTLDEARACARALTERRIALTEARIAAAQAELGKLREQNIEAYIQADNPRMLSVADLEKAFRHYGP